MSHPLDSQKLAFIRALVPSCPYVVIDARPPEVKVPDFLRKDGLVLRIGQDPNVLGMPDLVFTENGWQGTLSIKGARHFVEVPWEHCHAAWVGEPFIGPQIRWPVLVKNQEETPAPEEKRPKLQLVKD